jgi:hypothetical protein
LGIQKILYFKLGHYHLLSHLQKCLILSGDSLAGRNRAIVLAGGNAMKLFGTREIDNRDTEQVYGYMEARIEVLKRRIHELEAEKEALRSNDSPAKNYAASSRSITPLRVRVATRALDRGRNRG